jgi:hypothetical protein
MKRLIILLGILLIPFLANATDYGKWNGINTYDVTAPSVVTGATSTFIGTNGTTVTVTFSEEVVSSLYANADFNLDCSSAGSNIALNSISGSGRTRTFTSASTIYSGDTCNLDWVGSSGHIADYAGNALGGTVTDIAVTNSSQQAGYATPAVVQNNSGYSGGPATLSSNSTTGNTLVVCLSASGDTSTVTISSGGGVTTWNSGTSRYDTNNTNGRCYYGYVTSGGAVSVSFSSSPSDPGWVIYELSGIASSNALDGENYGGTNTFFDGDWESASVSTSQTHVGMVAFAASEAGAVTSFAWDAGWGNTQSNTDHAHYSAFRAVTSQGDYVAAGTNSGTTNGLVILMVFKAASQ